MYIHNNKIKRCAFVKKAEIKYVLHVYYANKSQCESVITYCYHGQILIYGYRHRREFKIHKNYRTNKHDAKTWIRKAAIYSTNITTNAEQEYELDQYLNRTQNKINPV